MLTPALTRVDAHTPVSRAVNPRTKAEQFYITPADAEAFHAKYFTPRPLVKTLPT